MANPEVEFTYRCPVCGYDRTGISSDHSCPECGAEGFASVFVVPGERRTGVVLAGAWSLLAFLAFTLLVWVPVLLSRIGNATARINQSGRVVQNYVDPPPSAAEWIIVGLMTALLAALAWQLLGTRSLSNRRVIAWTFHPRGVEVRLGGSRAWIPKSEIREFRCHDSLLGDMSQFALIQRSITLRGAAGSTPILYLKGSKQLRESILCNMQSWLAESGNTERGCSDL